MPAKSRAPRTRRSVPKLVCLEDRSTPAVIYVTTTDDEMVENKTKSLREAIQQANANPDADTIILKAGVYRITRPYAGEADENLSGAFQVRHPTSIRGIAASKTIIDGNGFDAVIDLVGATDGPLTKLTFSNLTIRGGVGNGAIRTGRVDLTLDRCTLTANHSVTNGGAISDEAYNGSGVINLVRCNVNYNSAPNSGGGIYLQGQTTLNVKLSAFRNNVALNGGGIHAKTVNLANTSVTGNSAHFSFGGGIFCSEELTITASTIADNHANRGGGIYSENVGLTSKVIAIKSVISGNYSQTYGGGIACEDLELIDSTVRGNFAQGDGGGLHSTSQVKAWSSTISGNRAGGDGGGFRAIEVRMRNATISGNSAHGVGGGMRIRDGEIINSTIVGNYARLGGGGTYAIAVFLNVQNSLIALNSVLPGSVGPDVSGTFNDGGNNLIGIVDGGSGFNADNSNQLGTTANPINPRISELNKFGGFTETHALLIGSPAINAGNNDVLTLDDAILKDQRGHLRRKGLKVDIGAFER